MTSPALNPYLHELKLYAEDVGPKLQRWYDDCQRPGEFQKRCRAIVPSTITHLAALFFFPRATVAGIVATAVMPDAIDEVMHNHAIQRIDRTIDDLNMTSTQKTALAVTGIVVAGLLVQNPYLAILPSLCTAKLMADITLDRYRGRA